MFLASNVVHGYDFGRGTANSVPKFSSASTIVNSQISDTGTLITLKLPVAVNGTLAASGALTATSVNGVLNAASFSGSDIGAQVNAAITACSSTCEIDLPPSASLSQTTTINVTSPGISLRGMGSRGTHLMFSGSGDAILIKYPAYSINEGGTFSNFQIDGGSSGTQTSCIHVASVNQIAFYNVTCRGFTGTTGNLGTGFWLDNQSIAGFAGWSERVTCVNCYSYANRKAMAIHSERRHEQFCSVSLHSVLRQHRAGQWNRNERRKCEHKVYDSWIDLAGNIDNVGAGTALVAVDGTSAFGTTTEFHVHVESQNSVSSACVSIAAGGAIMGQGWINCSQSAGPINNSIDPNGHFMLMGSQDPLQHEFSNNGVGPWLIGPTVNGNSGLGLNNRALGRYKLAMQR